MPPQKKNKKTFIYTAPTSQEILTIQQAARVKSTNISTNTWINTLEAFRHDLQLPGKIEDIDTKEELERQLVLFFVSCKQQNGKDYSVQSIKAARFAIARHINLYSKIRPQDINNKNVYPDLYNAITGKIKILTKSGFGESRGADAFTESEIQLIVNHPAMQTDSPKGLLRRIFWHNAFELALRGGEHYDLKIQHFVKRKDGGIDVIFYQSKCNQIRLSNSNPKSEIISIPPNENIIKDYELYFTKRPPQCDDAFYLQPCNQAEVEFTGYWYKSAHVGRNSLNKFMNEIALVTGINCDDRKFSNHSGRKTFVQYSKSRGISDNDVMSVSRHKNPHSLSYYERPKTVLQQNTLTQINDIIYKKRALEFYKGSISENCKFKALAYLNYHIAYYIIENNISPLPLSEKPRVPFQEIKDSQNIQLDEDCIKKFLQGNTFNNCNITFNMNQ
ncbi:zinc finger MYM-type protein 2-like [Rhizophagus clarus]|uniref:Zinc finger MYM-type protein 2-like n=1 Tax=Rhizophagus clarus TaxID=94130 RepID=A0A8H3MAF8_9GLOM|nr:zinc finger MYM-type protein 2-like [Rhizophagus clarus]